MESTRSGAAGANHPLSLFACFSFLKIGNDLGIQSIQIVQLQHDKDGDKQDQGYIDSETNDGIVDRGRLDSQSEDSRGHVAKGS